MEWEFPERDDGSKPQFHELSCRICVISQVPGFQKFDERNSATQLKGGSESLLKFILREISKYIKVNININEHYEHFPTHVCLAVLCSAD